MANERRLIDVSDEHIKEIMAHHQYHLAEIQKFTVMAKEFPTVDAVEIVRCGQCKYFNERYVCTFHSERPREYGDEYHMYMMPVGFCSYGKRRCDNG